jgi:hypothetical protein
LTEVVNAEMVVVAAEVTSKKEDIAERKTIVYETHIDPTVIRVAGEKIKTQLFTKYGLFKPKAEEIQFVSMNKYYEPYVVISGRYMIDYYRNCAYPIRVDKKVKEVVLFDRRFLPKTSEKNQEANIIEIQGEERLVVDAKAFLILDQNGQDAILDKVPSAPSEKNPEEAIANFGIQEIAPNADVGFVRDRIAKHPKDMSRIIEEVFEVSERSVIYTPRFKLLYKNLKTCEEKAVVIDGVTSKRVQQSETAVSKVMHILKSRLDI